MAHTPCFAELEGYRCPEHTHYYEGRQDQALEDARRLLSLLSPAAGGGR